MIKISRQVWVESSIFFVLFWSFTVTYFRATFTVWPWMSICSFVIPLENLKPTANQQGKLCNSFWEKYEKWTLRFTFHSRMPLYRYLVQFCALAEPGGPWCLTFDLGRQENLRFFIQIICWAPWILQIHSTRLPTIFLRAQPCSLVRTAFFIAVENPSI